MANSRIVELNNKIKNTEDELKKLRDELGEARRIQGMYKEGDVLSATFNEHTRVIFVGSDDIFIAFDPVDAQMAQTGNVLDILKLYDNVEHVKLSTTIAGLQLLLGRN